MEYPTNGALADCQNGGSEGNGVLGDNVVEMVEDGEGGGDEPLSEVSTNNPERSFIPTSYRLKFHSDDSTSSSSSSSSPSKAGSPSPPPSKNIPEEPRETLGRKESGEGKVVVERREQQLLSQPIQAAPNNLQLPPPSVESSHLLSLGRNEDGDGKEEDPAYRIATQQSKEDERWRRRREDRVRIGRKPAESHRVGWGRGGDGLVWASSPTSRDLEDTYVIQDRHEKRVATEFQRQYEVIAESSSSTAAAATKPPRKRRRSSTPPPSSNSSVSSSSHGRKRKKGGRKVERKEKKRSHKHHRAKKHRHNDEEYAKKSKHNRRDRNGKHKKKRRHSTPPPSLSSSSSGSSNEGEEWVELTNELRAEEAMKTRNEEAQVIGPQLPEHLLQQRQKGLYGQSAVTGGGEAKLGAQERKNMLRGEADRMAAYAAHGKRIPRRGEIGLSSNEISEFEKVGYVMSGTRHKAMEATRLRKENQILTADEKRLLNTFTQEQRQGREETVLGQFKELISSKKSKF